MRFSGTIMKASLALLCSVALAGGAGAQKARARGYLFIVGGGPQPPELIQRFFDLAGGKKGKIVVFAMASSEGKQSGEEKADDLRKLGTDAHAYYIDQSEANSDSMVKNMEGVTGVWFGGGDQVLLTKALLGTRVEKAIHDRYAKGAVVGGTSAGAAVMSNPMLTGEERHQGGVRPPSDSSDHFMTIARDNVELVPGFGMIKGALIDQHFTRRKRHNRFISVVLETPPHLGAGIDESTALIVNPDGHWTVLGESVVSIYDARHATITKVGAPVLGESGLILSVLPSGSSYYPATGKVVLPK
ncbi:MAG: cyanophycinase [Gemmatimonadota bacterium]|nr:cyanophycinase [Gemmatimonadota bacterium]